MSHVHLQNFLEIRKKTAPRSIASIQRIAEVFVQDSRHLRSYGFQSPQTSILVGQVQSGKTGHYLGIAAAVADVEPRFPIFLLLTQSLVALQQQTYLEAKRLLTTFDVFDESDEISFRYSLKYSRPKMIVLKKTPAPLRKWSHILNRQLLDGRPLFIIDDEADASGLNTLVNISDQSKINRLITKMVSDHNSFLLQVTATPQAIFLQDQNSIFRPTSHLYFPPGADYLGGNFFYPPDVEQVGWTPFVFKPTNDSELLELQDRNTQGIPVGLKDALLTFFLTSAYRIGQEGDQQCNFLLHPSARTVDHELIREKVNKFILDTFNSLELPELRSQMNDCFQDLKQTKPQLPNLDDLIDEVTRTSFNTTVMNSAPGNLSRSLPSSGANIFIGGNVLSRGIVIPRLQTIYYCRTAQRINLDTYWQHSRAFGYDRDPALVRLFMPPRLYSNYVQMNDSVSQLFEALEKSTTDKIQVVTPKGIQPTRRNVVLDISSDSIIGGANHFPINPTEKNPSILDDLLKSYDEKIKFNQIPASEARKILHECGESELGGVPSSEFEVAIENINKLGKVILIVRRNRDIGANTGTLLSPDDRMLAMSFPEDSVLVLYRLTGEKLKGWAGNPFWVPNVKLPNHLVVYYK